MFSRQHFFHCPKRLLLQNRQKCLVETYQHISISLFPTTSTQKDVGQARLIADELCRLQYSEIQKFVNDVNRAFVALKGKSFAQGIYCSEQGPKYDPFPISKRELIVLKGMLEKYPDSVKDQEILFVSQMQQQPLLLHEYLEFCFNVKDKFISDIFGFLDMYKSEGFHDKLTYKFYDNHQPLGSTKTLGKEWFQSIRDIFSCPEKVTAEKLAQFTVIYEFINSEINADIERLKKKNATTGSSS